jgi:hypothetical protein
MKFTAPTVAALLLVANSASAKETRRLRKSSSSSSSSKKKVGKKGGKGGSSTSHDSSRKAGKTDGKGGKSSSKKDGKTGGKGGKSGGDDADDDDTLAPPVTSDAVFDTCNNDGTTKFASYGEENSQQLLLREGVIDAIPPSLCGRKGKNVILVVGDGMGWEMSRAGAIAKQVVDELERMNCDTKVGCPDNEAAINAFATRTLSDYYESGKTQFVTCASVVTLCFVLI